MKMYGEIERLSENNFNKILSISKKNNRIRYKC